MKFYTARLELSDRPLFGAALWLLIPVLTFTLAYTLPAYSFRGQKAMDPEQMITELTETLALENAQVEKIQSIVDDQAAKRNKIFEKYANQGQSARKEMRSEMMSLRSETNAQIESVLTEEQIVKYEVYKEKKRREMQGAMRERRSERGFGLKF